MNILHYIFFILGICSTDLYLIETQNKKICADCKFFIANKRECSKFGNVSIITGKHRYDSAVDKCGIDAIFFKKNYFKFITLSYYFVLDNGIFLVSLCLIIGYISFIIK
jgi:hypothetical protein